MTAQPPNVLLIVTDDQGYGDFGCTGNPWLRTPALDALAADSVRLDAFHTDPMCAPSRAALLSGCHSARAGVWSTLSGRYFLNRDLPTIADRFRASGYRTGMFGKWHLGDGKHYLPQDRGFDEALYHGGGVIGEMPDHWDNDYFDAVFHRNGRPERFADTYCTDVWFGEATDFIERSVDADVPFFCYLPVNAPHVPLDVHPRYAEPYLRQGVPDDRARFFGMIANIDENVGRLRARLAELGISDDTIIVYLGDNGTDGGAEVDAEGALTDGWNAGQRGKKCWPTDGGHRNLCLLHWPRGGWSGGRDVTTLTAHYDLLPTLAARCGLAHPDGAAPTDGRDLSGILTGAADDALDGRALVVHNQQRDNPTKYKDFAVLTRDWRLVQTTEWGPGRRELHAARDTGQVHDLAAEHPSVVTELMRVYDRWWDDLGDAFEQVWPFYAADDGEELTLTAHAWHGTTERPGIYDQNHCRTGEVANGYWLVDVRDPGRYRLELRRWPREVDRPITAGLPARVGVPHVADRPEGVALTIRTARISVTPDSANTGLPRLDVETSVDASATAVTHEWDLPAGRYRVQTWLTDDAGVERGAYYAYLTHTGVRAAQER
ncbi:N-acetylgalactosamine-6-sulfatase [Agromyces rhizosphaerae]|uniref:N-acetylgalactosamine-6-sulfatase n=1 Tax=Agromyces rhizosphaerae TaxID=88374 RepID=A0A9W6CWJ5_9MICO|nr:arylsulfatase [Agromyces rhizosphaerae]GLI26634.1 N-acetylgalactosamine-6-sulfatase [Agromyces rhizosphaerae]